MSVTVSRNPNLSKSGSNKSFQHEVKKQFGEKWWTGLAPEKCPGFDAERNCLVSLPLINHKILTRQDVLDYFNNSWTLTELLFQSLKTEEAYTRPPYHNLRHPMIFYYGHPAVIFVNKMRIAGLIKEPIDLYLEKVLETGVDEMSWDDMSKNEMKWPSVERVREYRQKVYDIILTIIKTHPDFDKKSDLGIQSPWWALWMGFEHEKIHFETSSVLIRELPIEFVETPKYWVPMHPSYKDLSAKENAWMKSNGGEVNYGKKRGVESFGWDNEYGERSKTIKDFTYTKHQITNGEYFDFVASGSYINDKYWSAEGLAWRKFRNTKRPTFWVAVGPEGAHQYELRTLFDIIPMPMSWPCEVNFHEAEAYCRYKKECDQTNLHYRLLTEPEFRHLSPKRSDGVLQKKSMSHYKNLQSIEAEYKENFNFVWSTPKTVNEELFGNTWHWLLDQFNPLDGFEVHPLYDDFSTPCFDGKHQMILGGSFMSCGHEASQWARFHFRPHFYQHSGFRIAATLDGSNDNEATYLVQTREYIHPKRVNVLDQMNKSSDWWKKIEQPLELNSEEIKTLMDLTSEKVLEYSEHFSQMSPMGEAHDPKVNGLKENFTIPYQASKNFPLHPESYNTLLRTIFDDLVKYNQLPGHPGFAAYVAGAGNFISNTAQLIAQTLNPFTGHYMMAPGLVTLENEVIKWFTHMVGYDENTSQGFLTSGSSLASLSAISMARKEKCKSFDYTKVTAYASSDSHHCIAKAWSILGFKKDNLRLIPLKNFKMNTEALERKINEDKASGLEPMLIVATLGSTKTGAVDNLQELITLKQKYNLWLHGDGAYGALFMLTEKGQQLLKGINELDSIALDPHKALSIPYGTGCLLVKNKDHMLFDYLSDDSYMPPRPVDQVDYADITPELSRDFRGLRIWLPLKTLGVGPFKLNLEEKIKLAEWLSAEIGKSSDLEMISQPELTILTFAHKKGNEATKKLMEQINHKGTLFLSSCMIENKVAIRFCLLGFRLHYDRLEKAMSEIKEMARVL
jgi:5-histidylcysteine sulfoxide synthase